MTSECTHFISIKIAVKKKKFGIPTFHISIISWNLYYKWCVFPMKNQKQDSLSQLKGTAWSCNKGGSGLIPGEGPSPEGSGHGTGFPGQWSQPHSAGVQVAFRQCPQIYSPIFGWSCVEAGVGLDDSYRSLLTQDIILFIIMENTSTAHLIKSHSLGVTSSWHPKVSNH